MLHCSHGHTASWLTSTLQITAFISGGIFLILSLTWPCSMFLSPLPAHQHCRISPAVQKAANKQSPFPSPLIPLLPGNNLSPPPILAVPPPRPATQVELGQHLWLPAQGHLEVYLGLCQSPGQLHNASLPKPSWSWSQSSDRPICSHKGTQHKHSWKEGPWDNVSPSHCPKFGARCRWSAKLLCLAMFNKTHRLIYQPEG